MKPSSLVLNVNDHAANLYMVSKMLRNAGYRVAEARTGTEALAQVEAERPALVVLDVRLPDMSGFEVCRRIRANPATSDIKVLHTSATFISTENKIEGLEAGADGYLTQPFEPQDLIATVRSLIRLHDAERVLTARNEELMAADRRKDEFLAMLAHELRNPLAAVQAGLPLLERFPPHDDIESRTRDTSRRSSTSWMSSEV
jgi:two-component system, sensor histidine kinase